MEDIEFSEFYKLHYNRIPSLFKFNKLKFRIVAGITALLVLADIIMLIIIPNTQSTDEFIRMNGISFYTVSYSMPLFIAILAVTFAVLLLLLWIGIALSLEDRAVRKATLDFQKFEQQRRSKIWDDLQDHRLKNDF